MQNRSSSHSAHHLSIVDAQPHRDGAGLVDVDINALSRPRRWVIVVALIGAVLALSAMPARSQARPSDALVLARVCVHEASFGPSDDCAAIYAVLSGGAHRHGISFRSFAYAYSGRALRGLTSRPWVAQLDERGVVPSAWPRLTTVRRGGESRIVEHAPWSTYRERWLAALEHARAIVSGEAAHRCEREPHDWGGAVDHARAERLGLIRVDCGDTRNDFYVRPSLVLGEEG